MKVTVIKEAGLLVGGELQPKGAELELAGPLLDAALRFKEVEPAKAPEPEEKKKK